jgi:ubiquinone/menaquinone biosynthesis C-methylase UbiE
VSDDHRARATSFDATAEAYERGRPGYPVAALEWWDARGAFGAERVVVDLAAGTGKLTRDLIDRAGSVIAIEPLANMRAVCAAVVPQATVMDGTAERIPMPDHSVDAVLVAQAFHWFDYDAAAVEIARVLRRGGGLGLIWNDDDIRVPWVREFSDTKHRVREEDNNFLDGIRTSLSTHFNVGETAEFAHQVTTSADALIANALSRSYISVLPDEQRTEALEPIRTLVADLPTPIVLPMVTTVMWWTTR